MIYINKKSIKFSSKHKKEIDKLIDSITVEIKEKAKELARNPQQETLQKKPSTEDYDNALDEIIERGDWEEVIEQILGENADDDDERDSSSWLGSYHTIQSPGKIKLHRRRIKNFLYGIIKHLQTKKHKISFQKFELLARLTVYKTYFHELFHHFSDVHSIIAGKTHYDYKKEEALAVAAARHISALFCDASVIHEHFFKKAFAYRGKGYKDWTNYPSYVSFKKELVIYFKINGKLIDADYSSMEDVLESQYLALINNPFATLSILP
tara:strand:- start:52 stop:852 length:801 start_codon:yes stop_codon:yes gene_type:complete